MSTVVKISRGKLVKNATLELPSTITKIDRVAKLYSWINKKAKTTRNTENPKPQIKTVRRYQV